MCFERGLTSQSSESNSLSLWGFSFLLWTLECEAVLICWILGGHNRLCAMERGRGHPLAKRCSKPQSNNNPTFWPHTFVISAQLSPPWKYHSRQLRSSSAYGPGGNSRPWWPPGRALGWGAGAWQRGAGSRSPLMWWMSLKSQRNITALKIWLFSCMEEDLKL